MRLIKVKTKVYLVVQWLDQECEIKGVFSEDLKDQADNMAKKLKEKMPTSYVGVLKKTVKGQDYFKWNRSTFRLKCRNI